MDNNNKNKIIVSSLILLLSLTIFVFVEVTFKYNNELENIKNAYVIEDYVEDQNLRLPFPNWVELGYNDNERINNLMNLDIFEFHSKLVDNFIYSEIYDCKYWSYVWTNYWKYNKNEYNLKIISTNNHVFVILYNNNMYCIADQDILNCNISVN